MRNKATKVRNGAAKAGNAATSRCARATGAAFWVIALLMPCTASPLQEGALEGRWKATERDLVIDISRCGAHYCGLQVKAGNQCGTTVLKLTFKSRDEDGSLGFEGKLDLPGEGKVYNALLTVGFEESKVVASLQGTDAEAGFASRELPFEASLARLGGATCRQGVSS